MRKKHTNELVFERLEDRRVLAGNVHVLVNDAILLVVGDALDNQVEVSQDASGSYVVSGTDTTINGRSQPLVISDFVFHVTISMNEGNDRVDVRNVAVLSNFSFYGGTGNDILTTNNLSAYHMHLEGNAGDDAFGVDFETSQSAYLYLGEGNDVVSSSHMVAGRNLKTFGAGGNDTISASRLRAARKLEFHMDSGNDSILLSGESAAGMFSRIQLGDGNDFVGILPNMNGGRANLRGFVSLDVGNGDDNVAFDSAVDIKGPLLTNGGTGTNSFQQGGASFDGSRLKGFRTGPIDNMDDLIDQVFDRVNDSGIGGERPFEPLQATASDTLLNFLENSDPVAVAPTFRLTGSETVTGAEIEITDFAVGQEILSFSNTGNISGNFDASSGILTLTGNASTASYQSAIRAVQFQNISDNPTTTRRSFEITISTNSEIANVSRNFQVRASDDAPEITQSQTGQIVLPDDLPVVIDDQLTVTDPDAVNITSAEVRFVNGYEPGEDILSSVDSNGITSSFDESTGTLLLAGNGGLSAWQTVLRTVAYSNDSANPTAGVRTIRVTLNGPLTDSVVYEIDLQQATQPNTFTVSESAASGIVVGQVVTTGTFQGPMIYQFENNQVAPEILLNADDHIAGDPRASVVLIEYLDFQ